MNDSLAIATQVDGAVRTAYDSDSLRKDVLAGITVAAISLPQAMAYALIAGVDPRFGLYSAIVVTAIASLFGSSSHLINGPTNAISLVTFSALAYFEPEAKLDAYEAMFLLGILVGALQIAIAVLGLLEAIAISKSIASSTGQRLDYNRQCLAEGLANLGGGFFQCLPGSGSLTRSAINHQAGAVSRASGLFAAATVALVVALLAPLARFVPKPALAGLLMVTAVRLVDWRRLANALRASRFDAALVVVTAFTAIFLSVEYSILAGVALSIVLFVPRAAKLQARELTIAADRVIRGRQNGDPQCRPIVIYDLEGELFFGAALELDRHFDELRQRTRAGAKVVILRLRRTRNPDLVCLERLEQFIRELDGRGVVVLLSGVGVDVSRTMDNLRFYRWLPRERVFLRAAEAPGSSTIAAVRHAYRLLPSETAACPHCAAIRPAAPDIYYMI